MTLEKIKKRQRRKIKIRSKISGTPIQPRLVVYRSLNYNYAQLIDDSTGKCILATSDLKVKKGQKSTKAKEVGIQLAEKAKEKNISSCVFDRNGYKYHGRIKAIAEGAREGGLKF